MATREQISRGGVSPRFVDRPEPLDSFHIKHFSCGQRMIKFRCEDMHFEMQDKAASGNGARRKELERKVDGEEGKKLPRVEKWSRVRGKLCDLQRIC
jgi:hypothetical protein